MAEEIIIPNLTFAQPHSRDFFEISGNWLPFDELIKSDRPHFPPQKFIFREFLDGSGFARDEREIRRLLAKPIHSSSWPYLQLYEVHRRAVLDGLFTEHLSDRISAQERSVFIEYLRNPVHEFTNLVTKLFLTYREFERKKLFTVKKGWKNWRHTQVALMAIYGKDNEYYNEHHPGITEKELIEKNRERVEKRAYQFISAIDGIYPKHSSSKKVSGRLKQKRMVKFLTSS